MVSEKLTFTATDGTEFYTKEEAIAHEQVDEAYNAYQDAVKALNIAIAEKLVTADGVPFQVEGWVDYYYIFGQFDSDRPVVKDVKIDHWNFCLLPNDFGSVRGYFHNGEKRVDSTFRVDMLYVDQHKAWRKVLESLDSKKQGLDSYAEMIKQRCL
jgi:hypothetical protein